MAEELRRGGEGQQAVFTGVHVILDLVDLYAEDWRAYDGEEGGAGAGDPPERNSSAVPDLGAWMDEKSVYEVLERGGDAGRIWAEMVPHLAALLSALNASFTVCVPGGARPAPSSRGARARMGGGRARLRRSRRVGMVLRRETGAQRFATCWWKAARISKPWWRERLPPATPWSSSARSRLSRESRLAQVAVRQGEGSQQRETVGFGEAGSRNGRQVCTSDVHAWSKSERARVSLSEVQRGGGAGVRGLAAGLPTNVCYFSAVSDFSPERLSLAAPHALQASHWFKV